MHYMNALFCHQIVAVRYTVKVGFRPLILYNAKIDIPITNTCDPNWHCGLIFDTSQVEFVVQLHLSSSFKMADLDKKK